jgi:hypothetical protein
MFVPERGARREQMCSKLTAFKLRIIGSTWEGTQF